MMEKHEIGKPVLEKIIQSVTDTAEDLGRYDSKLPGVVYVGVQSLFLLFLFSLLIATASITFTLLVTIPVILWGHRVARNTVVKLFGKPLEKKSE